MIRPLLRPIALILLPSLFLQEVSAVVSTATAVPGTRAYLVPFAEQALSFRPAAAQYPQRMQSPLAARKFHQIGAVNPRVRKMKRPDRELINELWQSMDFEHRTMDQSVIVQLKARGYAVVMGDPETFSNFVLRYVYDRLVPAEQKRNEDCDEFMERVWDGDIIPGHPEEVTALALIHASDNIVQHAGGFGVFVIRTVPEKAGQRLEVFVLDRGAGFVAANGEHIPIEDAIRDEVSRGKGGGGGVGLTFTVANSDFIEITNYQERPDASPQGYRWQTGMAHEEEIHDRTVFTGTRIVYQKHIPADKRGDLGGFVPVPDEAWLAKHLAPAQIAALRAQRNGIQKLLLVKEIYEALKRTLAVPAVLRPKLRDTAFRLARGAEAGWPIAQSLLNDAQTLYRLQPSRLKDGAKKRLLTALRKVADSGEPGYERFKEVLADVEDRLALVLAGLPGGKLVRVFTAAWATGKRIDIFKQVFDAFETEFALSADEIKALALNEKIRLITAAYNVALGKEAGLKDFRGVLRVRRQDYSDTQWESFSAGVRTEMLYSVYWEWRQKHLNGPASPLFTDDPLLNVEQQRSRAIKSAA